MYTPWAKTVVCHWVLTLLVFHVGAWNMSDGLGLSDSSKISVSGLSSGADFAGQFLVAYSSTIIGAGIFAGQPYMCAVTRFPKDDVSDVCKDPDGKTSDPPRCPDFCIGCKKGEVLPYDHCKRPDPSIVEVKLLKPSVEKNAKAGLIDGLGNLSKRRVYLSHGKEDHDYLSPSVLRTAEFFRLFMEKPKEQVVYNDHHDNGHAYPVPGSRPFTCGYGQIFGLVDMPVQNCEFDGPGHALRHIYEGIRKLHPPAEASEGKKNFLETVREGLKQIGKADAEVEKDTDESSTNAQIAKMGEALEAQNAHILDFEFEGLRWFDQEKFMGAHNEPMLAKSGLIHVPKQCYLRKSKCDLHINFPGCGFVQDAIFLMLVESLDLNEWGDANNIVILYPRVNGEGETKDQKDGCWNVYGKTGRNYATKEGSQMAAVKSMIDAAVAGELGEAAGPVVDVVKKLDQIKKLDQMMMVNFVVGLCLICLCIYCCCCNTTKVADAGGSEMEPLQGTNP